MRQHPILKSYVVKYFYDIAKRSYGKEKARVLHMEHKKLCMEYASQYKDISKKEEMHYFGQILPCIAVYKVMLKYEEENADAVLQEIIERRSKQSYSILHKFLAIPAMYKAVPQICNYIILKSFSKEVGFEYSKIQCTKSEWKADIVKCPYVATCQKFSCVEIAHYFCDSDDLIYGNLHKKVLWKRTKTLGRGDDVCDFNVEIVQR